MSELANWFPDDVTFQPVVNKDHRAKEYLRRSWDKVSKSGQGALKAEPSAAEGASTSSFSVVDRLYAMMEKVRA